MANLVSAIDVSSYNPRDLTEVVGQYKPDHVVVKLYLPIENVSQDYTRDQIRSARSAGASLGGYVWCYRSADPSQTVQDAVALATANGLDLPVLWLDCETETDANGSILDPGPNKAWLTTAVARCRALGVRPGIYTGGWWWRDYMGDPHPNPFVDVPLWSAEPDGIADPGRVSLYGQWVGASGKQWKSTGGPDRDVFLSEVTVGVPPRPSTLAQLIAANPNLEEQVDTWQRQRRQNGADPLDYSAFRQHEIALGAPDPGPVEFIGFHRPTLEGLARANPNIGQQRVTWQSLRKQSGADPFDYAAFRQYQLAIGAPDPGSVEFIGFRD